MNWPADRSLRRRMVLALALVGVGYAVLLGIVFAFLPTRVAYGVTGLLLVALAVMILAADRIAYVVTDAVAIGRDDYPKLYDTVHRLSHQADLPPPPVAVVPTNAANAFSAGTGDRTVVCVTLGLLKELDDDELEAVLAHEVAHLANGDSTVLSVAALPTAVGVSLLKFAVSPGWRILLFPQAIAVVALLVLLAGPILVASLPATLALSRCREYAADRGAVALTGDPAALAEALATLHGRQSPPSTDLRSIAGLGAFCFVPVGIPVDGYHPPTAERIRRLRQLTATLEDA